LSVLYVRLGARSTSVRARLDPTEGSLSLLTFLCWIPSERQSLTMCNKSIQQIRYRSALMHFPVHLKISWRRKVAELATIECSPSEQQKPVKNSRFHMHGQQVCDSSCILVVLAVIVRTPKLEHDMCCQGYCWWKLTTSHQKYNYPIWECCHRELKCTFSYQSCSSLNP
jgi:hypothetical protein